MRRLEPKLRISYSLYKLWVKNDWPGVWSYLTETQWISTDAQAKGKLVHKYLEENGIPDELKSIVDKFKGNKIIDYKTGSLNGYIGQLNFYAWLARGQDIQEGREIKLEKEFDDYTAVGVLDYYIPGTSKTHAILAKIDPTIEDGKVLKVEIAKTSCYYVTEKWLKDWELILDEVANSIRYNIAQGELDKFLKSYYF